MLALGIDPSTATGFAVVDSRAGRPVAVYTCEAAPGLKDNIERAGDIAATLLQVLDRYSPDVVAIEGYGYGNTHTLVTLVEIGTVLRYFLRQRGVPYVDVAPTALKKLVTGKGNAKKNVMALEVYKRWGLEFTTDNITDAFCLGVFRLAMLGLVAGLPKANQEPATKLQNGLTKP